jgi:hypothetical protein
MKDELRSLFSKLALTQREIDAHLDAPTVLSTDTLIRLIDREHKAINALVLAMSLPQAVQELKEASLAAQTAHAAHAKGEISLEERNEAVRKAHDKRDVVITMMNRNLQWNLEEYNYRISKDPALIAEFGLHEANTLCFAS